MADILSLYNIGQIIDVTLLSQAVFSGCFTLSSFFVHFNTFGGINAIILALIYISFIAVTYYGIRKTISRTSYGAILAAAVFLVFISLESAIFWGQYSNCSKMHTKSFISKIIDPDKILTGSDRPTAKPTAKPSREPTQAVRRSLRDFDPIDSVMNEITYTESWNNPFEGIDHSRRLINFYSQCHNTRAMKSLCAFSVFMFLSYIFQVFILLRFKDDLLGSGPLNEGYGYSPVLKDDIAVTNNLPISGIPTQENGKQRYVRYILLNILSVIIIYLRRYPNSADL